VAESSAAVSDMDASGTERARRRSGLQAEDRDCKLTRSDTANDGNRTEAIHEGRG
jgi:hypothetical protein